MLISVMNQFMELVLGHACIGLLQKIIFSLVADSNENTGFTVQFTHSKLLYCKVKLTSFIVIIVINYSM